MAFTPTFFGAPLLMLNVDYQAIYIKELPSKPSGFFRQHVNFYPCRPSCCLFKVVLCKSLETFSILSWMYPLQFVLRNPTKLALGRLTTGLFHGIFRWPFLSSR